jgi:hypothetical protein
MLTTSLSRSSEEIGETSSIKFSPENVEAIDVLELQKSPKMNQSRIIF